MSTLSKSPFVHLFGSFIRKGSEISAGSMTILTLRQCGRYLHYMDSDNALAREINLTPF